MNKPFKLLTVSILGSCLLAASASLAFAEGNAAVPYNLLADTAGAAASAAGVQVTAKAVKEQSDTLNAELSIPVIGGLQDKQFEAELNDIIERNAMKDLEGIKQEAQEGAAKAKAAGFSFRPYQLTVGYELKAAGGAADNGILSLKVTTYKYTGGANGMPRIDTYNVKNVAKAARIQLSDLFGADYKTKIDAKINATIAEHPENFFKDKEGFQGISDTQSFYVEKGEAVIVFGKYTIAPGSSGNPEFHLPIPGATAADGVTVTAKTVKEENELYVIDLNIPVVSGLKDKKFEADLNKTLEQNVMKNVDEIKKGAKEDAASAKESGYAFHQHSISLGFKVTAHGGAADNGALSIRMEIDTYTGGAHGMQIVSTVNVKNGDTASKLGLPDLFGGDYKASVNAAVAKGIKEDPDRFFSGTNGFESIADDQTFYIDNGAAVIVFQPYEISPYAAGIPEFRIPLAADGQHGSASGDRPTQLVVNGKKLAADHTAVYLGDSGKPVLPLRVIAESLGYQVTWNDAEKAVELAKGAQWTVLRVGKDEYVYNKMTPIALGAAPVIQEDGRTYVPAAFFSDILKASVSSANGAITIANPS